MSAPTPLVCAHCGKSYLVQQHSVSVSNSGGLPCPNCRKELIHWHGEHFYTLAISPPKSTPEFDILPESEVD